MILIIRNGVIQLQAMTVGLSSCMNAYLFASPGVLPHCITGINEGIKSGCSCIVEIRGMQGCALVGDTQRAVGEYRVISVYIHI